MNSYRNVGWKWWWPKYPAGTCWSSIFSPHGSCVGLPKSSWLNQFPQRPIPCASSNPGATASMNSRTLSPDRRTIHAPMRQPSAIPPQTPRPPSHTANGPHHLSGTSLQLVRSWYARAPTIPNATPQTATRKTRSQSPPQRTQRQPVSKTQAAMASSSISPYMWIVSGPTSIVPLCGEGMLARNVTGQKILPAAAGACLLEQDLQRQRRLAAARQELDRKVEVDVRPRRQLGRSGRTVARQFELLGPPGLDQLGLILNPSLCRSHHTHVFGRSAQTDVPLGGDLACEREHLTLVQLALEPVGRVLERPEEDVAGEAGLDPPDIAVGGLPHDDMRSAVDPEAELTDGHLLDRRPRADELLEHAHLLALQLHEQHALAGVRQEGRDQPRLRIEPRRREAARQPQLDVRARQRDASCHGPPEARGQRPLLGRRQRLDLLDRRPADVEEVEDRAAGRRHRHRDPDPHHQHGHGEHERPQRTPALQPRAHGAGQIGRRRELELRAEGDECALELSHRTPATVRAHARCATSPSPAARRAS